jgi:hypothetical protein
MKKMAKKDLKRLEITESADGFTIWISETTGKKRKHWLVDASCLKDDGEIRIGKIIDGDRFHAIFDKKTESIKLVVSKP